MSIIEISHNQKHDQIKYIGDQMPPWGTSVVNSDKKTYHR